MFSVIITTHRRPVLLRRAIRSVKEQAGAARVILVSDVACEDTYRIASALLSGDDVFVQRGGQPGPAESRNTGIKLLETDFALFLDDDDALSPHFLAEAAKHASQGDVVYTDFVAAWERIEDGVPVPTSVERRSLAANAIDDIHVKNFIPPACLVYPTQALKGRRVDPTLILNEDWDFALNVLSAFPFRYVPIDGPIVYTREDPDNRGRSNDHHLVDTYRRIYKNRPAPTPALKEARRSFFASVGIEASLADL